MSVSRTVAILIVAVPVAGLVVVLVWFSILDLFDRRRYEQHRLPVPGGLYGSGPRRELDHPAVEADILAALEAEFDDDGRTA